MWEGVAVGGVVDAIAVLLDVSYFFWGICSQNGFLVLLVVGAGSMGFVQVDLWPLLSTLYNSICRTYVVSV